MVKQKEALLNRARLRGFVAPKSRQTFFGGKNSTTNMRRTGEASAGLAKTHNCLAFGVGLGAVALPWRQGRKKAADFRLFARKKERGCSLDLRSVW